MFRSVPRNIELFDRVVALTFVKLYEFFPIPLDIDAGGIGAEAAHHTTDDEEIFKIISQTAGDSIAFLVREGFVHYEPSHKTISGPDFPQATLTLKGLTLLGATPKTIDESIDRRPFIDQLQAAVREGAKDSVPEIIKSLFASALQIGAVSVGGG